MSETLLKKVNELLNEEKWTRATMTSYSIGNFAELDELIAATTPGEIEAQVLALCEEHLKHTRNSIIALYLSGILSLRRQLVDDTNLIVLINIFVDNHKWNIVEYLCTRILEQGENKFALKTLADVHENRNEQEAKYKIWERYIKVDYEEAEIVKLLAEKKEQEGQIAEAAEYYKKALHRFINKKAFGSVKEVWEKLITFAPEDTDFYFSVERKIVKVLSGERAATLLAYLYPHFTKKGAWDAAIEILKRILSYEPKNGEARKEIVECFRRKYEGHSQLEEYLRVSNLSQSWRNVHDAIADFEKHISFDVGNYVYHSSWHIGRIKEISNDVIVVDFAGKAAHKMSLKMAVSALKVLAADHIWVLIHSTPKEELKKRVLQDPVWALRTVIRSFDNSADVKMIKEQLVPAVLSNSEWTRWSVEARNALKTDPAFGNVPDKVDRYTVREKPMAFEEKTFNKFKAEKGFFARVQAIREFLQHGEPDSEYFAEMFAYFAGFLKSYAAVNEQVLCSFLLVQELVGIYPYLNPGLDVGFGDLLQQAENFEELFAGIPDPELRKSFLVQLRRHHPDWPAVYSRLFLNYQSKFIIDELVREKKWDVLGALIDELVSHYREFREAYVWMARNLLAEPWFAQMNLKPEKLLIGMVHLLDVSFRDIANKREVSFNRKINRQIQDFLFKEKRLLNHILESGEDSVTRLYTLVEDVKELDPSLRISLKQQIKDRYPQYKFRGDEEKQKVSMGILTTRGSYEAKQKELRSLMEEQIPQNSQEIGLAMSKGDLRENAEYKAALEKQEQLKTAASRMQEELQNAQIFVDTETVHESVAFGTVVTLLNRQTDKREQYTILGPWESDPSRNIISYRSPLGVELLNHSVGEKLKFAIGDHRFDYVVESIGRADLSGR